MNRNTGDTYVGPLTWTDIEIDLRPGPAGGYLVNANQTYGLHRGLYLRFFKPLIDRVGAILALVVTAPLMAVVALLFVIQRLLLAKSHRFVSIGSRTGELKSLALGKWRWPAFGLVVLCIFFRHDHHSWSGRIEVGHIGSVALRLTARSPDSWQF